MEKFTIIINSDVVNEFKEIHIEMEPRRDVMDVAEKLSQVYVNHTVSVQMYTRVRRSYGNGKVLSSNPDLSKFYQDVDAQMAWDWTCCGQVLN
jgi:hypothetical protein